MYGANISGIILGTIILHSSQRIFYNLIKEETEEDVERNDNICPQTIKQDENSKAEATFYPLWSVDSRGAGQFLKKSR